MFGFLRRIMNNDEFNLKKEFNSLHRILKTDIKKDLKPLEDEIFFGWLFLGS